MDVFIIESPSFCDLMENRSERESLKCLCEQFGHSAVAMTAFSKSGLEYVVEQIGSYIELNHCEEVCIHVSCHGNSKGISFGNDLITWYDFVLCLSPLLSLSSNKQVFIFLSSCGTKFQKTTSLFSSLGKQVGIVPPSYILLFNEPAIPWSTALLCWSIVYYTLGTINKCADRAVFQTAVKAVKAVTFGKTAFMYYRWDENKSRYFQYKAQK